MEVYMNGVKFCNLDDIPVFNPPEPEDDRMKFPITFVDSKSATFSCSSIISEDLFDKLLYIPPTRNFPISRGHERKKMISRAKKMRTNFTETFIVRKEGDHFVDERSAFRFILQ